MARKPLVVARNDFVNDVVNLINEAELPMFAIGDVLKEVLLQVKEQADAEYEAAKKQYEKELKEEPAKKEESK